MHKLYLILVLTFSLTTNRAFAQGCSDAGLCTVHSLKPTNLDSLAFALSKHHSLLAGVSYGRGDNNTAIINGQLEYSAEINRKLTFSGKVNYQRVSGNLGTVNGLSDITLSTALAATRKISLTAGFKIPLNDGNKKDANGNSLPMVYQTSLGTFDFITGFTLRLGKFPLIIAYQRPLTQNNNQFLTTNYAPTADEQQFVSTNKFIRSEDLMLRTSYEFMVLQESLRIIPAILPIWHLQNDKFTDASGQQKEIAGSKGLTFNLNLFLQYSLNERSKLELNTGFPIVARQSRPDGLTRKFVLSLEYRFAF